MKRSGRPRPARHRRCLVAAASAKLTSSRRPRGVPPAQPLHVSKAQRSRGRPGASRLAGPSQHGGGLHDGAASGVGGSAERVGGGGLRSMRDDVPSASERAGRLLWLALLTVCLLAPPAAGAWMWLRRRGAAPSGGRALRSAALPPEAPDEAAPMMFSPCPGLEGAAGGVAGETTDSGRGGVAVRRGPASHRACGRVRGPVRRVRPLSPAPRERRAHGLGHGRARDAGHGRRRRRGTLVP